MCLIVVGFLIGSTAICSGDFYVIPTFKKNYAPVQKTGQTKCYDEFGDKVDCVSAGQGQEGDLQKGVARPNPRFALNNDGTVRDNLTGLIWLRDASCADVVSWSLAFYQASILQHGLCGLSDGSSPGDWRLPNRFELESLQTYDFASSYKTLSNAAGTGPWQEGDAFLDVKDSYWSSTTYMRNPGFSFVVNFTDGSVDIGNKITSVAHVWPVRGGQ